MEKGKERHIAELQGSMPVSGVRRARSAAGLPPRQDGSEEGDSAQAVWETPALFCGISRLPHGRFNPQLVNPAKHFMQLQTPKRSRGITHTYNREPISVERRSLNCNLTEINFCTRITRYYDKLPMEDYMLDPPKKIFVSQPKNTDYICTLLTTLVSYWGLNCQIPPQNRYAESALETITGIRQ